MVGCRTPIPATCGPDTGPHPCAHICRIDRGRTADRLLDADAIIPDISLTAVHGIMLAFISRLEYTRPGIEVSSAIGER